jgi:hypothetical protein
MIPVILQGMGGALYYLRGHRLLPFNTLFRATQGGDSLTAPNHPGSLQPDAGAGIDDYFLNIWGGLNTYWPIGNVNLKPIAAYNGFIYQTHNALRDFGTLTITRFDGSGIFFDSHNAFVAARPAVHGPGSIFLSPSGGTSSPLTNIEHNTKSNDCSMIVHNDILFIVGNAVGRETSFPGNDWTQTGWNYIPGNLAVSNNRTVRQYFWASYQSDKDIKTFGSGVRITDGAFGNALNTEHTHMCDLASFDNDIYGASLCDVFRIHGGSGEVRLMYTNVERPCPKSFEIWPEGGIVDGQPVGDKKLLILESSGVLRRINTETKFPSGVRLLTNLGQVTQPPGVGTQPEIRTTDPWLARLRSGTDQPSRSCVLKGFNGKLNAFFTTAASGYQHVSSTGSPSGVSNWTNVTSKLPKNLARFDGNLYIAEDTVNDQLIVAHVTMGNIGVLGHASERTAGGATFIYTYGTDEVWREVFQGMLTTAARGLAPLQNLGPFVTIASGMNPEVMKCSDYSILEYSLHDLDERLLDVTIEFSIDQGTVWNTARRFRSYDTREFLGSGTTGLPTTLAGVGYDFYWDYVNDVGFNQVENCLLRVTPRLVR